MCQLRKYIFQHVRVVRGCSLAQKRAVSSGRGRVQAVMAKRGAAEVQMKGHITTLMRDAIAKEKAIAEVRLHLDSIDTNASLDSIVLKAGRSLLI